MSNAKSTRNMIAGRQASFGRVLGQKPVTNKRLGGIFAELATFIEAFSLPEVKRETDALILFWNFADERGADVCHSASCRIPVGVKLKGDLQVEVWTNGSQRTTERFDDWFLDRHMAVLHCEEPPLFLVGCGPIGFSDCQLPG